MIDAGLMDKHIECFQLLVSITVIIMASGDAPASMIGHMRLAINRHALLFRELYTGPRYYKVKWHHLFHLPDDLTRMRNMPSCFPMERKHNSNQGPCTCLTRSDRASTQHAAEYAEVTLD